MTLPRLAKRYDIERDCFIIVPVEIHDRAVTAYDAWIATCPDRKPHRFHGDPTLHRIARDAEVACRAAALGELVA